MFTAGVFTHSALGCHLTPQQQDKTDEERSANNRWRGQRRQILQQGALLPCRLTHRRLPPTARCGVLPRMCLTQVPKMFVLLSYEVRSAGWSRRPYRRCCYPAAGRPARGAWRARGTARTIRAAVMAGDRLARSSGFRRRDRTPAHHCVSTLLAAVRPPAPWPASWRALARGTVSWRQRTTALRRLLPSSQRLLPMISGVPHGHARDRRATTRLGRRPGSPGWRDGGGVTFRLMNRHRVAGSDRSPPAV